MFVAEKSSVMWRNFRMNAKNVHVGVECGVTLENSFCNSTPNGLIGILDKDMSLLFNWRVPPNG